MMKNKLVLPIIALIVSMVLLTFAAVPIYNLFCKATGFGGTTQKGYENIGKKGTREIKVRFDANVNPDLPWIFVPKQNEITTRAGDNNLVFYYVENKSNRDIVGTAVFNVTPNKAGKYFHKIHCFCFEEQLLRAGERAMMPVTFVLNPDLEDDPELKDVHTITLSYSFFKIRDN